MRSVLACLLAILAAPATASATWSVIAVDRATGRVVIASATCVNGDDMFLPGLQAVVVPGKGVAACQAAVDGTHTNQMLVFRELQKGTDPGAIVEMLSADPAFQTRQFGIVDLQGRSAGHSGLTNGYVAQDAQGQVPGTEIFYSIQGNILRPGEVVPNAVKAFLGATGMMTDRVMAAMEAADAGGGDSRCGCPPSPADGSAPKIPCDGKTAHVAYILLAEKTDTSGDSHGNGQYRMFIRVAQPDHGPLSIHEGENLNPVKALRLRYDAWRTQQPEALLLGQAPSAGSGQGRGRGVTPMTLTSSAWADGARIPDKHAQPGHDVSPPLAWSHAPDTAVSFVLVVHDLDAPTGNGTDDTLHWLMWNIPGADRALPEGVPQGASLPGGARQISATGPNYRGPAVSASGAAHHYVFELYALDAVLDVPAVGASPAQTRAAVVAAMAGHVRGKGVLTGTYQRRGSNP